MVYEKSGTSWVLHSELLPGNTSTLSMINADGTRLSFGNTVYFRSGTTWTSNHVFSYTISSMNALGDTVILKNATNSLQVYKFNGSSWSLEATITNSVTGSNFGQYGTSLSDDGNVLAVTAPASYGSGSISGSVYIYTRSGTTWTQQAQLLSSIGYAGDYFGYRCKLSGDGKTVAVTTESLTTSSVVTVFKKDISGSTWTEENIFPFFATRITAVALSTNGNYLVASSAESSTGGDNGIVKMWSRTDSVWTERYSEEQKYGFPSDSTAKGFGAGCHCDGAGNAFSVSAPYYDTGRGAVYLYYGPGFIYKTDETGEMTIIGEKQEISQAIDSLELSLSDTVGTRLLTYTATRSTDDFQSIRFQNIN